MDPDAAMRESSQRKRANKAVDLLRKDRSEKVTFFTGAGASFFFDYPLTKDLLPRIIEWKDDPDFLELPEEEAGLSRRRRKTLQAVLNKLLPGRPKDSTTLPLVTTLLSVVDYAIAHRAPIWPGRTIKGLRAAREILDHAIFDALEEYEPFRPAVRKKLSRFATMLRDVQRERKGRQVGLITTNYDMSSDWTVLKAAFEKQNLGSWTTQQVAEIDFGTEWLDGHATGWRPIKRPSRPHFHCYKLHGSTNWLRCPICQQIFINVHGGTWFQGFRTERDNANSCFCSETKLDPQIVSPSFVRQMDDLNLLNIWSQAHTLLCHSNHWVIIGYSLPEEDVTIRSLLTRAIHCREGNLRVTVVQNTEKERAKYEALFGKRRLQFISGGLEMFLHSWFGEDNPE
ncbi:MAG: hypothetical protein ABJF10_10360 [Chthoniobacter sp.]|uniref:hypothetical protein n=1 Tax=Chthoniobacter sp. TaxID=2510640 RepID=UPI0032ADA2B9